VVSRINRVLVTKKLDLDANAGISTWRGLGKLGSTPSNTFNVTRNDVNNLSGSVGLLVQSLSDRPPDDIPLDDLETAKQYDARFADIAKRLHG
jgi:hypothetical protein